MLHGSRRQALSGLSALGATFGISGCTLPISAFCPNDPITSDPNTPLTVDVHTHVFNGSDLQIGGFISHVLALENSAIEALAPLLQQLGRDFAPTGNDELSELQKIDSAISLCDERVFAQTMARYSDAGYRKAATELKSALRSAQVRRTFTGHRLSDEVARQIRQLPESRSAYKDLRRRKRRLAKENIAVAGAIDFIIRNFQYRFINVHDYLDEYSTGKKRKIDLLVAHLVDFDWPIGRGESTSTPIYDQIRVMEQIARLTNGRVHCFAPYDPFKEVARRIGLTSSASLPAVQAAVMNHGFIGVKLYPTMGFAPLGNSRISSTFWNVPWLPPGLRRHDIGHLLDDALVELYGWCKANDVPIMAHTSPSNGPSQAFKDLTKSIFWKAVRDSFPGIRVNFGHFGETDLVNDNGARAEQLSDLMTPGPSPGQFLYADSAYLIDLLSRPTVLRAKLAYLLKRTDGKRDAALANRLMYGTDWEMLVVEGRDSEQYLKNFEMVFAGLTSDPSLADRFFGANAASFLGLQAGQRNRDRLNLFYLLSRKPAWITKVDRLLATV